MNIAPFDFDLWLQEMLNLLLWPLSGTLGANLTLVGLIVVLVLIVSLIASQIGLEE